MTGREKLSLSEKNAKTYTRCITTVAAIMAIVIIELKAISMGIDGVMLGATIAALAGLGGYELKAFREKKEEA